MERCAFAEERMRSISYVVLAITVHDSTLVPAYDKRIARGMNKQVHIHREMCQTLCDFLALNFEIKTIQCYDYWIETYFIGDWRCE